MRHLLFILLFLPVFACAQQVQYLGTISADVRSRGKLSADSGLNVTVRDTICTVRFPCDTGDLRLRPQDGRLYYYNGLSWQTTGVRNLQEAVQGGNTVNFAPIVLRGDEDPVISVSTVGGAPNGLGIYSTSGGGAIRIGAFGFGPSTELASGFLRRGFPGTDSLELNGVYTFNGALYAPNGYKGIQANNGVTNSGDTLQLGDTVKKAITVNIAATGSLGFLGVGTTEKPILVHGLRYFNQNNRRNIMFVSYDPANVLNGSSTRGTYIGPFPFQNILTGTQNVGVGHDPGNSCQTCNHNIAIGAMALYTETQVDDAIAIGRNSLGGNTKGNGDIGIGQQAGSSGTTANCGFFGNYAGYNLSGTNTTVLGNWSNASPVRSISNALLLGGDGANAQNVLIGGFTSTGAKLQVTGTTTATSDIEVTDSTKGIILKSPDGTRYRVTVANGGTLTTTVVP